MDQNDTQDRIIQLLQKGWSSYTPELLNKYTRRNLILASKFGERFSVERDIFESEIIVSKFNSANILINKDDYTLVLGSCDYLKTTYIAPLMLLFGLVSKYPGLEDASSFLTDKIDFLHDDKYIQLKKDNPIDYFNILYLKVSVLRIREQEARRNNISNIDAVISKHQEYKNAILAFIDELEPKTIIKIFGYNGDKNNLTITGPTKAIQRSRLQALREIYGYDVLEGIRFNDDETLQEYLQGKTIDSEKIDELGGANRGLIETIFFKWSAGQGEDEIAFKLIEKYMKCSECNIFETGTLEFQGQNILSRWFEKIFPHKKGDIEKVDSDIIDKYLDFFQKCFSESYISSKSLLEFLNTGNLVSAPRVHDTILEDLVAGNFIPHAYKFALDARTSATSVIGSIITIYQKLSNSANFNEEDKLKYKKKILDLLMQSLEVCNRDLDDPSKVKDINYFLNAPLTRMIHGASDDPVIVGTIADALLHIVKDKDVLSEEQITKVTEYLGRFGVVEAPNNVPGMKLYTSKELASILSERYRSYIEDEHIKLDTSHAPDFITSLMGCTNGRSPIYHGLHSPVSYKLKIFARDFSKGDNPLINSLLAAISGLRENPHCVSPCDVIKALADILDKSLNASSVTELDVEETYSAVLNILNKAMTSLSCVTDQRYLSEAEKIFKGVIYRHQSLDKIRKVFTSEKLDQEDGLEEIKSLFLQIQESFIQGDTFAKIDTGFLNPIEASRWDDILQANNSTWVERILEHTKSILEQRLKDGNITILPALRDIYTGTILPALVDATILQSNNEEAEELRHDTEARLTKFTSYARVLDQIKRYEAYIKITSLMGERQSLYDDILLKLLKGETLDKESKIQLFKVFDFLEYLLVSEQDVTKVHSILDVMKECLFDIAQDEGLRKEINKYYDEKLKVICYFDRLYKVLGHLDTIPEYTADIKKARLEAIRTLEKALKESHTLSKSDFNDTFIGYILNTNAIDSLPNFKETNILKYVETLFILRLTCSVFINNHSNNELLDAIISGIDKEIKTSCKISTSTLCVKRFEDLTKPLTKANYISRASDIARIYAKQVAFIKRAHKNLLFNLIYPFTYLSYRIHIAIELKRQRTSSGQKIIRKDVEEDHKSIAISEILESTPEQARTERQSPSRTQEEARLTVREGMRR